METELKLDITAAVDSIDRAAKAVEGRLGGLRQVVRHLAADLDKAFDGLANTEPAQKAVQSLDKQLLVLRLSLGKLKAALGDAAAPIAQRFLPMVQQAVYGAIRLAKNIALVTRALFGGAEGTDAMAESQEKLTVSSGKAARSLASFDTVERLDAPTGSGGGSATETVTPQLSDTLSPQLQAIVERIRGVMDYIKTLLAPLGQIDLTPAAQAFGALGDAIGKLGSVIGMALEWAWFNILVPLAKWTIEEAAPAAVELLSQAFQTLAAVLEPVLQGIGSLMTALKPVAVFVGQTFTMVLGALAGQLAALGGVFTQEGSRIGQIFRDIGDIIGWVWAWIAPILERLRTHWLDTLEGIGQYTATQMGNLIDILGGLTAFLAGVFTGDWNRAWNGLKTGFRGIVNSIIGLLNGMISGLVSGINSAIGAVNKLSIKIPDWLPLYGGKTLKFSIPTVSAPQIPYLAKGAVLPANQPFLAVVGDQRHGTNVEAPLSTIQEAVALVMQDQTAAILSGFEASVGVQREILEAVLGIQIGDDLIGSAVTRYTQRQAVIRGGAT